jgi:hypothetical protein
LGAHGRLQAIGGADLEQTRPLCLANQVASYKVGKGSKRHQEVAQGKKIGDTRLQLAIVKEVLLQLEAAQETRTLTAQEFDLRR